MSGNDIWKHVKVDPDSLKNNRYINPPQSSGDSDSKNTTGGLNSGDVKIDGNYSFIEAKPYAVAVHKLRKSLADAPSDIHPKFTISAGTHIFRPLTFKENIEARINDYETKNPDGSARTDAERQKLFKVYLDSCTGIAYKAGATKFKIAPICPELINIDKSFNSEFKPVDYATFTGKEFDSSQDIYNSLLTETQFLNHKAYKFLYEEDANLMKAYWKIVHTLKPQDTLMGLWARKNTDADELRVLCVYDLDNDSDANGFNDLNYYARFLRVAQRAKK